MLSLFLLPPRTPIFLQLLYFYCLFQTECYLHLRIRLLIKPRRRFNCEASPSIDRDSEGEASEIWIPEPLAVGSCGDSQPRTAPDKSHVWLPSLGDLGNCNSVRGLFFKRDTSYARKRHEGRSHHLQYCLFTHIRQLNDQECFDDYLGLMININIACKPKRKIDSRRQWKRILIFDLILVINKSSFPSMLPERSLCRAILMSMSYFVV